MKPFSIIIALMLASMTSHAQSCPDNRHPHAIDLGLPSGTIWACCNVGASSPEDSGKYYAWSETEEKEVYSEKNRLTYKTIFRHLNAYGMKNNVAHIQWGGKWKMPTVNQANELFEHCTSQQATIKGVKGMIFKGKNGASIFMPAAGQRIIFSLNSKGNFGYYWTEEQGEDEDKSFYFYFHDGKATVSESNVHFGRTVRPIITR